MITVDRENSKLIINEKTFPLVYALCCPVTNNPVFVIVKANLKSLQSFVDDSVEFKAHHENIVGMVFHNSGSMYLNPSKSDDDEDDEGTPRGFIYLYGLKEEFLIHQAYERCTVLSILPDEMTYGLFKEKLLSSQLEKVHTGREVVKGTDLIIFIEH